MGIMQTETIIATLLAAASFLKRPVQDLVTQSVKDAYDSAHTGSFIRPALGRSSAEKPPGD